MDVGALIRRARDDARLTQRQLAERAGVSRHAISHYEHGRRLPGIRALTAILAAAGRQLRVELEPLDADVRAAIARVAAQPMERRDAVTRWSWLREVASCPYRMEGVAAANLLGAPLPMDYFDLAVADTQEGYASLVRLAVDHPFGIRACRECARWWVSPAYDGARLRDRLREECPDGRFWLSAGFSTALVRMAPEADVARHVEVATPHGPIRVAPLHEIESTDPQVQRVLRVLRELQREREAGPRDG